MKFKPLTLERLFVWWLVQFVEFVAALAITRSTTQAFAWSVVSGLAALLLLFSEPDED